MTEYFEDSVSLFNDLPSLDQENVTFGAPLARHINFPMPPLLLAAFAICGDMSMTGFSIEDLSKYNFNFPINLF